MQTPLRIVVAGMMAGEPGQGGATWAVLQYLLGLQQLGQDVYFVEPVSGDRLRPPGATLASSTNAAYFRGVVARFGFEARAALLLRGTAETVGLSHDALRAI